MKVYILIGGYDYEDSYILGVYSTEEKAIKAKQRQDNLKKEDWSECDWTEIVEMEVK